MSYFANAAAKLLENSTARRATFIAGALYLGLQVSQGHWALFNRIVPSIHVRETDDAYPAVSDWTAREFGHVGKLRGALNDFQRQKNCENDQPLDHKPRLTWEPFGGRFWFFRDGHCFFFERTEIAGTPFGRGKEEEISLTVIHWSVEPLKVLLQKIVDDDRRKGDRNTIVFAPRDYRWPLWKEVKSKSPRKLESVIMDQKEKDGLNADISEYLAPHKRKEYAEKGIPWRRGYLFYGPPGTGKTSLALAIAAQHELPIYVITLSDSGITDSTFTMLLQSLPIRSLLLLEDIDSAGLAKADTDLSGGDKSASTGLGQPEGALTRSGFINALDGVASGEGYVLVMTTNHLEKLDEAMIRPGRVDVRVHVSLATKDHARQMFNRMYSECQDEQANLFSSKIPENKLSAAQLQGFMMTKKEPQSAIEDVDAWLEELSPEETAKRTH